MSVDIEEVLGKEISKKIESVNNCNTHKELIIEINRLIDLFRIAYDNKLLTEKEYKACINKCDNMLKNSYGIIKNRNWRENKLYKKMAIITLLLMFYLNTYTVFMMIHSNPNEIIPVNHYPEFSQLRIENKSRLLQFQELQEDLNKIIEEKRIAEEERKAEEIYQKTHPFGIELNLYELYYVDGAERLTDRKGVVYFNGHRETWYSEKVLPGGGLNIPGRHVANDGTIRDSDGYICVASDLSYLPRYSTILTSLGPAKVYDTGCSYGTIDIYVNW